MTAKRMLSFVLASLMLFVCSCASDRPVGGGDSDRDTLDTSAKPLGSPQSELLLTRLASTEEKGREASTRFSEAMGKSAFDYFSSAIEDGREANILISPLSVYIALAMTACGAEGETLSQMQGVLGDLSIEDAAHYLYELCEEMTASDKIKLDIANSIWTRDDKGMMQVNEDFLSVTREYFSADNFMAAFDDETLKDINGWIEEKTDGMIKEMLEKIPDDAVMYLINALVFEADWQDTYDTTQIREGDFTSYSGEKVRAELMWGGEDYYLRDVNATGFIKPYADSRYAFVALLPNEDADVYDYASALTGERFANILDAKERATVSTAIPQFSYEYKDSFVNELKALGMTDAFNELAADLRGLGTSPLGNIYISEVLHKTFIEVSPKGTKAGAATVVEAVAESAMMPVDLKSYKVILDRPFVYAIVDTQTGTPIFLGILSALDNS